VLPSPLTLHVACCPQNICSEEHFSCSTSGPGRKILGLGMEKEKLYCGIGCENYKGGRGACRANLCRVTSIALEGYTDRELNLVRYLCKFSSFTKEKQESKRSHLRGYKPLIFGWTCEPSQPGPSILWGCLTKEITRRLVRCYRLSLAWLGSSCSAYLALTLSSRA
jgi:hypothetical protein